MRAVGYVNKVKDSFEPDSNQRPKDINYASTVLRSTNWAIEGTATGDGVKFCIYFKNRTEMPSEANWTAMFYGFINGSDFKWLQKQIKDNKKNCRLKITNQQVDWENWRPYGSGELLLFPIFRQARPWLLQGMFTAEKRRYNLNNQDKSLYSITIKSGPLK